MTAPLNVLLSGPGLIGREHARRIAENADCTLAGVVGAPGTPDEAFAEEAGARFHRDLTAALAAGGVDAAIVAAPSALHFEQARACIEAGVPVLVEKPVTDRIEDARRLAELARDSGVPVLVGHHRTHSALLRAAEAFVAFLTGPEGRAILTRHGFLPPDA